MTGHEAAARRSPDARFPNARLSLVAWLLPASGLKNLLLRRLGNQIGAGVRVGPTLVLRCGRFRLGDGASIGTGNVFRNVAAVELGPEAFIGGFNQITAAPGHRRVDPSAGRLVLGRGAGVINRHYLDCSGRIEIGEMAMIAGIRSILQSHELDLETNRAGIADIVIGERTFTGTKVLVLSGAVIPPRSVLAAGSTWPRTAGVAEPGLYAGTPARRIKGVEDWAWPNRVEIHTPVGDDGRGGAA